MSCPESFAVGWRSLPTELTLMILSYALPSNIVLSQLNFNQSIYEGRLTSFYPDGDKMPKHCAHAATLAAKHLVFDTAILPFLSVPELAPLATEVIYTHNTIDMSYEGVAHARIFTPPVAVRKYIRKLKYRLYLSVPAFKHMRHVFKDGGGFGNLSLVEIEVVGNLRARDEYMLSILESMAPVIISAKELRVTIDRSSDLEIGHSFACFKKATAGDKNTQNYPVKARR